MFKYAINRYYEVNWRRNIIEENLPKIFGFAQAKSKEWAQEMIIYLPFLGMIYIYFYYYIDRWM